MRLRRNRDKLWVWKKVSTAGYIKKEETGRR
jgi:hypothetical protein